MYKFSDHGNDGYLNSIMCQIESLVKDSLWMTLWEMAKIVNNAKFIECMYYTTNRTYYKCDFIFSKTPKYIQISGLMIPKKKWLLIQETNPMGPFIP